jgi:hypothetical protein
LVPDFNHLFRVFNSELFEISVTREKYEKDKPMLREKNL